VARASAFRALNSHGAIVGPRCPTCSWCCYRRPRCRVQSRVQSRVQNRPCNVPRSRQQHRARRCHTRHQPDPRCIRCPSDRSNRKHRSSPSSRQAPPTHPRHRRRPPSQHPQRVSGRLHLSRPRHRTRHCPWRVHRSWHRRHQCVCRRRPRQRPRRHRPFLRRARPSLRECPTARRLLEGLKPLTRPGSPEQRKRP
jgi:hypothetical protein